MSCHGARWRCLLNKPKSIAQRLLKATLLMALYTIRSERPFCEQLDYNLLYAISLRIRKRVEEVFGWMKTVGNFRKTRYVAIGNNQLAATMVATAYNLIRMANLLGQPT
jgi:hypothetical protein